MKAWSSFRPGQGVDINVLQEMPGPSTSTMTRDTYTSVFDELKHAAAEAIVDAITATMPAV
jgi:hypothetical protein